MNKSLINITTIGILIILTLISCKSKMTFHQNIKVITKACELNKRINDTIVVSGIYSNCMEYSSFNLIEKDNCYEQFDMDLNLNNVEFTPELDKRFDEMQGCGVSMEMILKGVLQKDSNIEYGHLGTNNSQLEVLEFVDYGKVKYHKLKEE